MKKKDRILRIQEGQWSITIPIEKEENTTLKDLEDLVIQLRTSGSSLKIKEGWKVDHI